MNFRSLDPIARLGQQSYPVVVGDRMYVTTGEGKTYALDATTGKVIWKWYPDQIAVFNKAGIVANRGVAVCDGKVFVLNIDMTITMLNQQTGDVIKRVPISSAVPGAATRYGYSETSAPICANHRVITGAAGSEYGVRGFVMAFKTSDLSPAWANPVWSIPPSGTQLAQGQPDRRRRRDLDAGDDRHEDEHGLLRHGLGDAALLPRVAAGLRPAHRLARSPSTCAPGS